MWATPAAWSIDNWVSGWTGKKNIYIYVYILVSVRRGAGWSYPSCFKVWKKKKKYSSMQVISRIVSAVRCRPLRVSFFVQTKKSLEILKDIYIIGCFLNDYMPMVYSGDVKGDRIITTGARCIQWRLRTRCRYNINI